MRLQPIAGDKKPNDWNASCIDRLLNCGLTRKQLGLTSLMVFFAVLYFVVYCYFIRRALKQLSTRPASDFRIANVAVRIQVPSPAASSSNMRCWDWVLPLVSALILSVMR